MAPKPLTLLATLLSSASPCLGDPFLDLLNERGGTHIVAVSAGINTQGWAAQQWRALEDDARRIADMDDAARRVLQDPQERAISRLIDLTRDQRDREDLDFDRLPEIVAAASPVRLDGDVDGVLDRPQFEAIAASADDLDSWSVLERAATQPGIELSQLQEAFRQRLREHMRGAHLYAPPSAQELESIRQAASPEIGRGNEDLARAYLYRNNIRAAFESMDPRDQNRLLVLERMYDEIDPSSPRPSETQEQAAERLEDATATMRFVQDKIERLAAAYGMESSSDALDELDMIDSDWMSAMTGSREPAGAELLAVHETLQNTRLMNDVRQQRRRALSEEVRLDDLDRDEERDRRSNRDRSFDGSVEAGN